MYRLQGWIRRKNKPHLFIFKTISRSSNVIFDDPRKPMKREIDRLINWVRERYRQTVREISLKIPVKFVVVCDMVNLVLFSIKYFINITSNSFTNTGHYTHTHTHTHIYIYIYIISWPTIVEMDLHRLVGKVIFLFTELLHLFFEALSTIFESLVWFELWLNSLTRTTGELSTHNAIHPVYIYDDIICYPWA